MKKQDIYNAPKHAGVYIFKNTINGKCYVGKAIKVRQKLIRHFNDFEQKKDTPLYKAFEEYGIENFELSIPHKFISALSWETKKLLDYWEKHYKEKYNSYVPTGYNQENDED